MSFSSILFLHDGPSPEAAESPACFSDLNLDQIVEAITAGKEGYNLRPFFQAPLKTTDAVLYRHEVMRDLENGATFRCVLAFAARMRDMRACRVQEEKLHHRYQKERWFFEAVRIYVDAVGALRGGLSDAGVASRGFQALGEYLGAYILSEGYQTLLDWTRRLTHALQQVSYRFLIKGATVKVRTYESEVDFSAEVAGVFEKFKQGAVNDYRIKTNDTPGMNHVEESVLEQVAKLYPETFADLDAFREVNAGYLDDVIGRFDREAQFYVSYLEFIARFKAVGLPFCYPSVSETSKEVLNREGFDLALAVRLQHGEQRVVCNDFSLTGNERIIVVSGPNQGGKTTFARTFGQVHWLGSLGCPVPGTEARLHLFDELFTHFEREETIDNLRGKLQDELTRIHEILGRVTTDSIVIMNEIFSSTTVADAVLLGKKIMQRIMERDLICVCVTFLDELASLTEQTVSMVSTVVPENPALRTYKVLRRPADGLSYAIWIAEKHRLTYPLLKERVRS